MTNTLSPAFTPIETPRLAKLLTLNETAEILRKSPKALAWMIHAGTAPRSGLIGGRRMFRAEDVEAYIADAFAREAV